MVDRLHDAVGRMTLGPLGAPTGYNVDTVRGPINSGLDAIDSASEKAIGDNHETDGKK